MLIRSLRLEDPFLKFFLKIFRETLRFKIVRFVPSRTWRSPTGTKVLGGHGTPVLSKEPSRY